MVSDIVGSLLSLWHSTSWNGHTGHFFRQGLSRCPRQTPIHYREYHWVWEDRIRDIIGRREIIIMDREKRIKLIRAIVLIGFWVAVVYHYEWGVVGGIGYPFNTFLFRPESQFGDFPNFLSMSVNFDPYLHPNLLGPGNYLPFVFIIGFILTHWDPSHLSCSSS